MIYARDSAAGVKDPLAAECQHNRLYSIGKTKSCPMIRWTKEGN